MTPMPQLRLTASDDVLVATISGEIDMASAGELADGIRTRLTNRMLGLVMDLSAITYLDSAGIHAIFELREQLGHRGQELWLVMPEPGAALALTLAGVPDVIPVAETADAAREAIAAHPGSH